jgi:hypothetical protein
VDELFVNLAQNEMKIRADLEAEKREREAEKEAQKRERDAEKEAQKREREAEKREREVQKREREAKQLRSELVSIYKELKQIPDLPLEELTKFETTVQDCGLTLNELQSDPEFLSNAAPPTSNLRHSTLGLFIKTATNQYLVKKLEDYIKRIKNTPCIIKDKDPVYSDFWLFKKSRSKNRMKNLQIAKGLLEDLQKDNSESFSKIWYKHMGDYRFGRGFQYSDGHNINSSELNQILRDLDENFHKPRTLKR